MPLLEVEQKFSFSIAKLRLLGSNTGHPPFKQLKSLDVKSFHDTYYDSHNKLSSTGLWVRKRHYFGSCKPAIPLLASCASQEWEAKQRISGSTFTRSTFSETQDPSQIFQWVNARIPKCPDQDENFGLNEMCSFKTFRQSFLADEKFKVVLDNTDFDHHVGEVEVLAEIAEQTHADIDEFMGKYKWFFDKSKPKGKLTAYFERFGIPK